jgi:hypothetical protein
MVIQARPRHSNLHAAAGCGRPASLAIPLPEGASLLISATASKLELDLAAELDHTVGRDTEEFGRSQGVAVHRLEQLNPDPAHS